MKKIVLYSVLTVLFVCVVMVGWVSIVRAGMAVTATAIESTPTRILTFVKTATPSPSNVSVGNYVNAISQLKGKAITTFGVYNQLASMTRSPSTDSKVLEQLRLQTSLHKQICDTPYPESFANVHDSECMIYAEFAEYEKYVVLALGDKMHWDINMNIALDHLENATKYSKISDIYLKEVMK